MKFIKKGLGKIVYNLSRVIDIILGFIIDLLDFIIDLTMKIGKALMALFSSLMLIFMLFLFGGVVGLLVLPFMIRLFVIFGALPFMINIVNKVLKLVRYGITEYLYDKSNSLILEQKMKFNSLIEYFKEYIRIENEKKFQEEERKRREFEENQRRKREAFEEFFRQSTNFSGGFGGDYYNQNNQGYSSFGGINDIGFKERYENACDILEVSYNANKNDIKIAYRKKAKEYHPDLNKSENATEMFQKINDAHEFLTDENIIKYGKVN